MKFSLLALLVFVVACSTSDSIPANVFVGTWRLATYCKPTSTTACTTITVPTDKSVLVTFDSNGQYTETYQNTTPAEYGFLSGSGNYSIENKDLRIRTFLMSSMAGQLVKVVSVDSKRLVLNPFSNGEYIFVR
ncbi:lipocalin family protein [Fibrella forsythiae]|uniref:Lipocalin family protein n=1 Tax=Fibrella forsythiae TaxID=2817061 RepID=A0ABS3JMT6_9BACT|nr:lipocalin family protein [Fibrella forsythiae]MBO0950716.1 lipocalin family protein [Fibrella forsythiae]